MNKWVVKNDALLIYISKHVLHNIHKDTELHMCNTYCKVLTKNKVVGMIKLFNFNTTAKK